MSITVSIQKTWSRLPFQ